MLLIPIGLAGVVLFSSAATRPPRASPKCAAEAMPTVDLYAPGTRASYAGNLVPSNPLTEPAYGLLTHSPLPRRDIWSTSTTPRPPSTFAAA